MNRRTRRTVTIAAIIVLLLAGVLGELTFGDRNGFGVAEAQTSVGAAGGAFVDAALGARTDAVPTSVAVSAWWLIATVSGLALMVCGLLALVEGPSWPRLGARYSRPSAGAAPSAAATWDALDRGEDPTIADGADPGSMEAAGPHSEEDR